MKKSLIVIHGGTTFDSYDEYFKYLKSCELTLEKINRKDWKDNLINNLPNFEVIYPKMPNSKNARYPEWKLWFEKTFNFLTDEVVLVGHSLGGYFLLST
jgi:predicted alpha/beta hydrolase family esterase